MFEFKTIMNNIKNLEWKKYFYKNLLLCSLAIFFVFTVITITLTKGYRRAVDNELSRYCMEVSFNVRDRINKVFNVFSESYSEFLGNYNYDLLIAACSEDITSEIGIEAAGNLKTAINTYKSNISYIDSIYIYFPTNKYIISNSTHFSNNYRAKFSDKKWIDTYEKKGKLLDIRNTKIRNINKLYLTVIKPINAGGQTNLVAYNIDINSFLASINEDLLELHIVDVNNNVVCSTTETLMGAKLENAGEKGENILKSLNNMSQVSDSGEGIVYTSAQLNDKAYKIVIGLDSSVHDGQINKINTMVFFIIILVVFLTVLLAFVIVSEFYNNILDLVMVIEGKDRSNKRSFREITFIKNKILTMIDKNSKIETELANRVELVSKTKLEALQSQLNSHFLYNTLGLISAIDILENKRDTNTVKAISSLSEILRFAMNRETFTVPLSEELVFMRKYLDIQRFRYKDKFEYSEEIDESLLGINVIKMIIQPLLENAVFHGIVPSGRKCKLVLKIGMENDILKIQVTDNGVGITQEKITQLREDFKLGVVSDVHTHGLLSVNQRCMLFYGPEYGCEIECENGITTVTVKHPVLRNGDKENEK